MFQQKYYLIGTAKQTLLVVMLHASNNPSRILISIRLARECAGDNTLSLKQGKYTSLNGVYTALQKLGKLMNMRGRALEGAVLKHQMRKRATCTD